MITKKIFTVSGQENPMDKSSNSGNGRRARQSGISKISFRSGLLIFSILCCCGIAMSILTLIPRHNSILYQKYWYEISIPASMANFTMVVVTFLHFIVLVEKDSLVTIGFFFKTFIGALLTWIICFCITYLFWTLISEYNHPMPLLGIISGPIGAKIGIIVSFLVMLPNEFIRDDESKMKVKNFVLYELGWAMAQFIKIPLFIIFKKLENSDAQCVMALLIPLAKRFTNSFCSKMMRRVVDNDNERANFLLASHINITYGLFMAICCIGGRVATVVCMVVADILIQSVMTRQIFKLHKKVTIDEQGISKKETRKAILKLLLAELCEGLVPMAYAICFAMAYYGPNAELLGNVRNGYWQNKIVEDVSWTFQVMFWLFLMDIVCLAMNSIFLWMFCKVNFFEEFNSVMDKYWFILAVKLVNELYLHFYPADVNFGMDITGKFDWIESNKNFSSISNSTDI